jgi:phytanoyl-CoA hydroxylase
LRGRIRSLLGEEVYVPLAHHNCIMTKQPGYSSDTGWHQDVRYWSFQRGELVNAWLALGAEGERSGALRLIPGSQRVPLQPEQFDGRKFFRDDLPENRTLIDTHVVAELSGGDVLFFDARCLHAASRNYTEQTKYSVVFSFRPADNPPIAGTRSTSLPELRLP